MAPPISAAHAQAILNPTRYELSFEPDFGQELLRGTARITMQNPTQEPVQSASLIFYRLLNVRAVRDERGRNLAFNQAVTTFEDFAKLQVNQIVVTLAKPLAPGARTVIEIQYDGHLLGYAETGMRYIRDKIDPEFTILRQDSYCYPQPGLASLAANRGISKWSFTWSAKITVPKDLVVANGGRQEGAEARGDSVTFRFSSLKPSWRMDFAIAKYNRISSGNLQVYHLPGDDSGAVKLAHAAEQALDLFTRWFGPLRQATTLTFIEIPDGWGSQADVTTVIQTAAAFRDPKQYRQAYHEISHLWNVPPTDLPSPRWNEGLATFLECLATQELTGEPAMDQRANELIERLRGALPRHPEWTNAPLADYGRAGLTDLSYSVGALFFDLLYRLVGQATFNTIFRQYYAQFAADGGSTKDLVAVIKSTAKSDTSNLVSDWLHTTAWATRIQQATNILQLADYYRHEHPNPPR